MTVSFRVYAGEGSVAHTVTLAKAVGNSGEWGFTVKEKSVQFKCVIFMIWDNLFNPYSQYELNLMEQAFPFMVLLMCNVNDCSGCNKKAANKML